MANSAFRPHKRLLDHVARVIRNEPVFTLLDEQQVAYNAIMDSVRSAGQNQHKVAFIVAGGPGTGKSVLAVNLVAELASLGLRTIHVTAEADARVRHLESKFAEMLSRLDIPRLSTPPTAAIDRRTYMPLVDGRRFEELSSQGLQVLVNVAHALAHHASAIDLGLPLPGLLLVDGPTSNLGHEGPDLELGRNVFRLLDAVADEYRDALQIIAADNDVPDQFVRDVTDRLTLEDRLVRQALLRPDAAQT